MQLSARPSSFFFKDLSGLRFVDAFFSAKLLYDSLLFFSCISLSIQHDLQYFLPADQLTYIDQLIGL